ncbi:MAG: MgtC/SapB family protein [Candidatus Gracilibacteria bacterium]
MLLETITPEYILSSPIFRLLFASFLGSIIGLERDFHGRSAGLRTNLLVSLGAAVFMILSESIALSTSQQLVSAKLQADPGRIAAQVITGIGFLGAGAIIKNGLSIRGLTTAACLWISAGIGMSVGAGQFDLGIITTLISLFALTVLNKAERHYKKNSYRTLEVVVPNTANISEIIDLIQKRNAEIMFLEKEKDYDKNTMNLNFSIKTKEKKPTDELSTEIITGLEKASIKIHKIKWSRQ